MKRREIVVLSVEVAIAGVLVIGIISLFTPTPVTRIISPFTPTPGYYPDLSISMDYNVWSGGEGGGYGWKIDGYGNMSYEGSGPGGESVKGSAKITPQQVQELVATTKKADAWAIWAVKHPFLGGILCYACPADLTTNGQEGKHLSPFEVLCMGCPKIDLSFTVNGHSQHISHSMSDWGCVGQGSPPRGLCDLENKVEAIGQSAIPAHVP